VFQRKSNALTVMIRSLVLAGSVSCCNYHALHNTGPGIQVEDEENLELMRFIDEEFLRYPFYGSRKMKVYLNRRGFPVNRKRVQQRLMPLMGLESIAPKPNTSGQRKEHKVYHYLLKKMSITEPDQVWCSDITYIRLAHGGIK